jgi:hypothetical protein
MMLTRAKSGGSSSWWAIGIVLLPVGALLWAWSQRPGEDLVNELAAKPVVAAILEEDSNLFGKEADDVSAMSRGEIEAAHFAILDRLHDSADTELARIRLGMLASVAAFCFWCIGISSFLLAGGGPQRISETPKPGAPAPPVAEHSSGLVIAGF